MKFNAFTPFLALFAISFPLSTPAQTVALGNSTQANQPELIQNILGSYIKGTTTYQDTAWPLFVSAAQAGLCKDTVYRTGFSPQVIDTKMEEAYIGSTGILPGVTVNFVIPKSPADIAGLRENDQVAIINGQATPSSGKNISKRFSEMYEEAITLAGKSGGGIELEVRRGTEIKQLKITPVKSCDLTISAMADGGRFMENPDPTQVMVSPAVMDEATDDTERQIVIAYAMSKNLSGAVAAKRNANRAAKFLGTVMQFAPLAMPVDPTVYMGAMLADPATKMAGELFAASKNGNSDELSLAILKASGISANQVLTFWEKYLNSDANTMVFKWVNGSAMTKARLDVIRAKAAQEVK
ncbi:M48 family metallopeptidase [Arenimonas sp. GDDSR-1]|uniref:M48 family metallopeptidase n=1 Tax=Arenimonas sp. GDDSR-1 TaxID=2950125 RepID=UPI002616EB70|nr:M48 family metallopeptidase [Arenimonas sp. GDDSR-1]